MSVKISKIRTTKARNCKIHPVLYNFFLQLKRTLGAEMVHRRKRSSNTCIEIIFNNQLTSQINGHLHTMPEAEKWGFFVLCRPQTNPKHMYYHGRRVFLLYLSPVHPKKCRAIQPNITSLNQKSVQLQIGY